MVDLPDLNLKKVKLTSLSGRFSKVSRRDFAKPLAPGRSLLDFFSGLPNILAAGELKEAAAALAEIKNMGRTIMLAMGGHPIKVGLSPLIIDLMQRGLIDSISVNGSVMVHDTEVALVGSTSEDVAAGIGQGEFGVTHETGFLINLAARQAVEKNVGLGQALGELLLSQSPPYVNDSIVASAVRLGLPLTVHVAIGTDVYNNHPDCDGACLGQASLEDFKTFCRLAATLEGGAFMNLGSAVIMPEVFLKAISVVRNLGYQISRLTTINLDFIKQYRPLVNVVGRPTQEGGRGYCFIGHHEIMFPLLMSLVLENLEALKTEI